MRIEIIGTELELAVTGISSTEYSEWSKGFPSADHWREKDQQRRIDLVENTAVLGMLPGDDLILRLDGGTKDIAEQKIEILESNQRSVMKLPLEMGYYLCVSNYSRFTSYFYEVDGAYDESLWSWSEQQVFLGEHLLATLVQPTYDGKTFLESDGAVVHNSVARVYEVS